MSPFLLSQPPLGHVPPSLLYIFVDSYYPSRMCVILHKPRRYTFPSHETYLHNVLHLVFQSLNETFGNFVPSVQRASSVLVTGAQDFGVWIPRALGTQSSLDGLPGWFPVVGHRQQSYSKSPCKRVMSKCLCSTSRTAHGRAKGVNYRPVALSLKGSRQRTLW